MTIRNIENKRTWNNRPLSEKQELLLSRFHDGECSSISAFLARRLLSKRPDARLFIEQLEELSHECSDLSRSDPEWKGDLWERIERRIDEEERLALYLGARRIESPDDSFWKRFYTSHALVGGLSGAAIAAVAIMVVARPASLVTFSAPSAELLTRPQLVQPAGIRSSVLPSRRYQATSARARTSLEVDWMRANGTLKLIPDPSGSSAVIWVRRRPVPRSRQGIRPNFSPTPLGLSASSLEAPRQRLDEQIGSSSK